MIDIVHMKFERDKEGGIERKRERERERGEWERKTQ